MATKPLTHKAIELAKPKAKCYAPVYLAGNSIKYPTVFHARF